MSKTYTALSALAGLAVLSLAACSDNGSTNPGSGGPTAEQVQEVSYASQDELNGDISSFSLTDDFNPIGFSASAAAAIAVHGPAAFSPPACVTANPVHPMDSDSDGIPDDVTLTFDCSLTIARWTLARTGQMRIQDTNENNPFDATQTLTDFAWSLTDHRHDRSFTATRNGSRSRIGTHSAASLTINMNIVRQRTNKPDATIQREGTITFTAAEGDSLFMDRSLPNGTINVTGSQTWTRGSENYSFTVTTVTPLVYDASCTDTDQRISAGELDFAATVNGQSGTLKLVWTACDVDPTRTWVPAS